ncbi:UPF0613 protein PB24D3.06c-like isoform X2 [Salvia hispanica]|uniref:UPF0613 protein PB24D3.06c-like isoform X2 n=1 Tax=Salvia hispanica TaxID=49212 RepID=UPI0020097226|nr:UPF0613 protein PB24D3.06c-like isoform X2 [Salvia hispanica]
MAPNSPTGAAAAVNNKYKLNGVMFKYGPKPIQVAFKVGNFKQQVVFVGGFKEGILATEYLEPLAFALEKEHWSLVQFLFSSSYSGYGISTLKQDANELDQLISYLIDNEDSHGVILLGHGHGCQAPVSDREYFQEAGSMIDLATTMINHDRPYDFMPRKAHPDAPITAYRYHSLHTRNGEDDMFSSDLSDKELKEKLGHMSATPSLVIYSMAGEHVPQHVNKQEFGGRLCRALGGAEMVEIESANHSLSNWIKEAVHAIMEFVKRDGLKGCEDPWS